MKDLLDVDQNWVCWPSGIRAPFSFSLSPSLCLGLSWQGYAGWLGLWLTVGSTEGFLSSEMTFPTCTCYSESSEMLGLLGRGKTRDSLMGNSDSPVLCLQQLRQWPRSAGAVESAQVLSEGARRCGWAPVTVGAPQLPGATCPGLQTGPPAKHGDGRRADLSSGPILPRPLLGSWEQLEELSIGICQGPGVK